MLTLVNGNKYCFTDQVVIADMYQSSLPEDFWKFLISQPSAYSETDADQLSSELIYSPFEILDNVSSGEVECSEAIKTELQEFVEVCNELGFSYIRIRRA